DAASRLQRARGLRGVLPGFGRKRAGFPGWQTDSPIEQRTIAMLKILGRTTSSNVQKVLWCCAELAIPFEREDVGGPFGKNNTPEYLSLNPNGLVPTMDDDGFILWESNAIVRYLCAKHGVGKLWPTDPARRADADRWMDWQQTTLAPPMGILFRALLRQPPEAIDAEQINGAMQKATA